MMPETSVLDAAITVRSEDGVVQSSEGGAHGERSPSPLEPSGLVDPGAPGIDASPGTLVDGPDDDGGC